MTGQSKEYKRTENVDAVGDLPGADRARDLLKISLDDQGHTLVTKLADALASEGDDTLLVEQASTESFAVDDVGLEADDGAGNVAKVWRRDNALRVSLEAEQIGLATETTLATLATESTLSSLAAALASDGSDTLQVDQQGVVDVSSRDSRNLGDVDVTALPDHDEAADNASALASGETITHSLAAPGADALRGKVVRASTAYDLHVDWKDANGNVLFTTDVATGVAGGTETTINEATISPYCDVRIVDAGAAAGDVTSTLHLR